MSSTPAIARGWLPTTPTVAAVQAREAADDVRREVLLDLEELAVVDQHAHDVAHVVGLVRVLGDDRVEPGVHPIRVVGRLHARRRLEVVLRQEREQVARVLEAVVLVVEGEVRDAGLRVVADRAAELLELDLLARDRPDHVGTRDEHVRRLLDHQDEVGHRGRVDRAARARPHHQADLRDHAGALDVAHEHVAVGAERDDALLDARAAGVVDADHRAADPRGQVHHLAHLLAHDLAERAAEDREVLREDAHAAAVDRAVAGHDRVAQRARLVHLRSRACDGARRCRARGRSRGRAASRSARARCTCPSRAASRRPSRRRGGSRSRAAPGAGRASPRSSRGPSRASPAQSMRGGSARERAVVRGAERVERVREHGRAGGGLDRRQRVRGTRRRDRCGRRLRRAPAEQARPEAAPWRRRHRLGLRFRLWRRRIDHHGQRRERDRRAPAGRLQPHGAGGQVALPVDDRLRLRAGDPDLAELAQVAGERGHVGQLRPQLGRTLDERALGFHRMGASPAARGFLRRQDAGW